MYLQIAELGKRFSALFTGVLHYLVVYFFPVPASCVITLKINSIHILVRQNTEQMGTVAKFIP
jgi:hypothetical protein